MKTEDLNGVWPVMLTPFTKDNKVDYNALEKLVHWYINNGVKGLFAVCQSSEMFFLSLKERRELAYFIAKEAGDIPVIASGHISDNFSDQVEELNIMGETGIDALILISNRIGAIDSNEDVYIEALDCLIRELPSNIPLGIYECPYPYKKLMTPKVTRYCADSKRFYFLKDTCCNTEEIKEKLDIMEGSNLKLFNANTATLLDSLRLGAAGYSGVMANFHPQLYQELMDVYKNNPKRAEYLQDILTMCSLIEKSNFPMNAKYMQQLIGNEFELVCRNPVATELSFSQMEEVKQLLSLTVKIS